MSFKARNMIRYGETEGLIVSEEDIKSYLRYYLSPRINVPAIQHSVTKVKKLLDLCQRLVHSGGNDMAAKMEQRAKLNSATIFHGAFTLNFTINPNPRQNRYALKLVGLDVDLDVMVPTRWIDSITRGREIINHPYETGYFFHSFINSFITTFLCWDYNNSCPKEPNTPEDIGIWGLTKGNSFENVEDTSI